jgi:hypothetical protein
VSSNDLHVTGGVGGTDAYYEDIATLAHGSDNLALSLARISAECHAMLADPDLLASAVLDPAGAATFETTLLGALDGPNGLTALAAGFRQRAIRLRAVAASYQAVDAAQAHAIDTVRWAAGYAFAETMPGSLLLLAGGGTLLAGYTALGGKVDYQRLLTDHPGIVDNVVGAGPGLLSGLPGPFVSDVMGASHLVGMFYPDGRPSVTSLGVDTVANSMKIPPTGFGDLMAGLNYRNGQATEGNDQIDVRVLTHPDGTRSYIVDIPGTKVWDTPGTFNPNLNDLGTNVHVLGGDMTAREQAIAEALHRAGASPTDPVMLIGHSQGGMVAAQAAHDSASGAFGYHVTHVMTAGSPIAHADVPSNVQVLALENSHDIIPHLDAAGNVDRPNVTTVTFDNQLGTIGANHATGTSYLPAAQSLDASTDPSVTAYRNSAGAFLTGGAGTSVQAQVYQLTRLP